MKIDKEVYKYIEYELRHFEKNKRKLEELRDEIIESSPEPPDGMPKGQGSTGNPTESKVLKLITSVSIKKLEDTVDAITTVYSNLTEDHQQFFDWNYVKNAGIVKTCMEVHISEKTYYRWKDTIIDMVATELGLK